MSRSVSFEYFNALDKLMAKYEQDLSNESALAQMMVDAAAPMVARAKSIVGTYSSWPETTLTRGDIRAAVNKERAVGSTVAIDVGASGKRAFILRFHEQGTSKKPPMSVLGRAWDETMGAVRAAILAGLAAHLK